MHKDKLIKCVICGNVERKPEFATLDVCWLCIIEAAKKII